MKFPRASSSPRSSPPAFLPPRFSRRAFSLVAVCLDNTISRGERVTRIARARDPGGPSERAPKRRRYPVVMRHTCLCVCVCVRSSLKVGGLFDDSSPASFLLCVPRNRRTAMRKGIRVQVCTVTSLADKTRSIRVAAAAAAALAEGHRVRVVLLVSP